MNRKTILDLALVCFLSIAACSDKSTNLGDQSHNTSIEKDGIEYSFGLNDDTFASQDTVRMLFVVTNKSNDTVEFGRFNKCWYCGFAVRQDGTDIWQSCRIAPPCEVVEHTLQPGESFTFQCTWDTISDNRTFFDRDDDYPVPPGTYTVTACPEIAQARQVELLLLIRIGA